MAHTSAEGESISATHVMHNFPSPQLTRWCTCKAFGCYDVYSPCPTDHTRLIRGRAVGRKELAIHNRMTSRNHLQNQGLVLSQASLAQPNAQADLNQENIQTHGMFLPYKVRCIPLIYS